MSRYFVLLGVVLLGCRSEAEDRAPRAEGTAKAAVERTAKKTADDGGLTGLVYAGSNQLRAIDVASRRVVASVPLGRAIREIRFDPGSPVAYVAASGGTYVVDTARHRVVRQLSDAPTRALDLSDDGGRLTALWHRVIVREDGIRDVRPFSLTTYELPTFEVSKTEEIGQRVTRAYPATEAGPHAVVTTEASEVRVGRGGLALAELPERIDAKGSLATEQTARLRHEAVRRGTKVFLPVQAQPSRILIVDQATGQASTISLGAPVAIRGLDATRDGQTLLVNVASHLLEVDVARGEVVSRIALPAPMGAVAVDPRGRWAALAQVVDGTGGSVHLVSLTEDEVVAKIPLPEISPWAVAAR